MGFWKDASKFLSKQTERAMLLVSGMQWGDAVNDQEKIVAALEEQYRKQMNTERLVAREENSTLVYAIIGFITSVIILIIAVCFKFAVDAARNHADQPRSVQLNTLRRGTVSNTGNVSSTC